MPHQAKGNLLAARVEDVLDHYLSRAIAETIIRKAYSRANLLPNKLTQENLPRLCSELERSVRLFVRSPTDVQHCIKDMHSLAAGDGYEATTQLEDVVMQINTEVDVVHARARARDYSKQVGFGWGDQVRIATVVSELVRNIIQYADSGTITFSSVTLPKPGIRIVAEDRGSGIPNLEEILSGDYVSSTGMGLGLLGAKRIMDEFDIQTGANGTHITVKKFRY